MIITIYGKPNCTYCTQAKALALAHGIHVNYVDITQDDEAREQIMRAGFKTVPQIYLGEDEEHYVGGFLCLQEKINTGEIYEDDPENLEV